MKKINALLDVLKADLKAAITPELKAEALAAAKAFATNILNDIEQILANIAFDIAEKEITA